MAKARIKREKDFTSGEVTFTVIESGDSLTFNVNDLPANIQTSLAVHGLNAKVGDSAANPEVDAIVAMQSTYDTLATGEWREGGGGDGAGRTTQLAEALSRVTGQEMDDVNAKLAEMDDDEKKSLKKHPQIVAMVETIRDEKQRARAKAAKAAATDAPALEF